MPMVRKARCPSCGSPKSTPTQAAYIYCDYCGQLMDVDVERLRAQAKPAPPTGKADKDLSRKINRAKGAGDRAELMSLYRVQQAAYVDYMGSAYFSPRIHDPEFRERQIEFLAYQRVVGDLSDRVKEAAKVLDKANTGMEMEERDGRWVIKPSSLWPIIEAQQACVDVLFQELGAFPDPVPDPDGQPLTVVRQLGANMYIAGFMTMIDDATAKELLQRVGLEASYEHVPDPETHGMFCGHCGAKHELVAGARRVLCESCGKHSDVGHNAQCHSCGSRVVIGVGMAAATCGHCNAEVRLVPRMT